MEKPETQGYIPVVSCFEGKYVYTSEVWRHGVHQRHKSSPSSPVSKPRRLARFPLSGGLKGDDQNFYIEVEAQLHNLIGDSQKYHGG
jgi:hypothetical protein